MLKINLNYHKLTRKFSTSLILLLFLSVFLISIIYYSPQSVNNRYINNSDSILNNEDKCCHPSSAWGLVNLTNIEINETLHYRNTTIPIEGELLDPAFTGIPGYTMVIQVDGKIDSNFNDTSGSNGEFTINYTIPFWLDIYNDHIIEVDVWDPPMGSGGVRFLNHFVINCNATSLFDVDNYNWNSPQLAGGTYQVPGYLTYDNGTGIPSQQVLSSWYNKTDPIIPANPPFFTGNDGSFQDIPIPDDNVSNILYLNLTYLGYGPYINGTQSSTRMIVYRNITCQWSTTGSTTEGNTIAIQGRIFSKKDQSLIINFTEVRLRRNGASIGTTFSNSEGIFSLSYSFPAGTAGANVISVEILNFPTVYSNVTHIINVAAGAPTSTSSPSGSSQTEDPPFQNFFIIIIPIIIGIVAGFVIYAILYLRKQEEESRLVKLPLEGRIRNLKILKDSGRLEEALSYLFQSIYLELIKAKYGRQKTLTETIRDFAIISVRDLNLNPAIIYPFIQNIERIIYDKPFIIKENDFYDAVELFSPIYFELTGYNFILNF